MFTLQEIQEIDILVYCDKFCIQVGSAIIFVENIDATELFKNEVFIIYIMYCYHLNATNFVFKLQEITESEILMCGDKFCINVGNAFIFVENIVPTK